MLRIACESCRAPYQVDERRVPPVGLKMRCPKCGHSFVVKPNGETAGVEATTGAGKTEVAPRILKSTMVGVQAPKPLGEATPVKDPPSASKLTRPELPKARTEPLPKPAAKPPPPPRKAERAHDPDLPAARTMVDADLPAAKGGKMPAARPAGPTATELDLPATKASPNAEKNPLDADLPARVDAASSRGRTAPLAKAPFVDGADLPASKGGADLPAARANADLPATRKTAGGLAAEPASAPSPFTDDPFGGGLDSFGEIDLPALGDNLPSVAHQLPATANQLPSVANQLPATANQLPAVANALQARHGSAVDGDPFSDPSTTQVTQEPNTAASSSPLGFDGLDDLDGFGEAVLGAARKSPSKDDVAFGSTMAAPKKASLPPKGGDELSFGEVDLGGGSAEESASSGSPGEIDLPGAGTEAAPSRATEEGTELALPVQSTITQAGVAKRTATPAKAKKPSRAPAILLTTVLVGTAAGAALNFTPYGAFGRFVISDSIHGREYDEAATKIAIATRSKAKSDLFVDTRAATEEAAREHASLPRAHGVAAYAAASEFLAQLRFGRVPERAARAKLWLQEIPAGKETQFVPVARALQAALDQDLANARTGLEAASRGPSATAAGEEIALGRGEVELRLRSSEGALAAFGKAAALQDSARAHFGLARAHALAEEADLTKKEIDATLKLSPNHTGARILRANILWDFDRDEKAALADLATVIDKDGGAGVAPDDLANAYAERGWVHLSKGRAGEARAAFESGLKGSASNVRALLGLGELLFNEGRTSEALARFDLALQGDGNNPAAVVASAKTKMMLERLQDAKVQLTVAKAQHPKYWRVPYWLARTEQILGNQEAAEKEFTAAIALVNPKHPDAVLPYASLASFLAERGRAKEAHAKLEEAQKKLPDSSLMERALGDVALADGALDRALTHFQASTERDLQDPNPHFRLAMTYRRLKRLPEAQAELAKVEELDKEFPGLIVERGLLFEASGEVDKALAQFKRALDKAPDDVELQLRVGFAYVSIDRTDEAVQILRKVWEKRQDSAQVNHALGRALMAQGESKIPEALRFLKRAIELDATHAEYHLYLAMAANDSAPAQLGLAKHEIERTLALDPELPEGFWQRGALSRKEGRVDDALRDVKKAIEMKPTRLEAFATLAECYEDRNEDALAIEAWRRALEMKHPRPFWRYRYAKQMHERKQWGEVANQLALALPAAEAYDIPPGWLADAEFLGGEAFRIGGRRKEAVAAYRKFLDIAPGNSPDRRDAVLALEGLGEKAK